MDLVSLFIGFLGFVTIDGKQYEANWDSIDSRPIPAWYDQAKVGIFLHWGVYSVPSFGKFTAEHFWRRWVERKSDVVRFMKDNFHPEFTYADFAPQFRAEMFDPEQWVDLFQAAGARYVVLTAKHHEGYTLWPSKFSFNWNSMDVGPHRDLVGDLALAVRSKSNIKFGLYHSMFEWYHPLFLRDQENGFHTQEYVRAKCLPELYEMVNTYQPDIVWSDGENMAADSYWNATEFIAWLYNESPVKDTVVINDRWGNNTNCMHGGFWDCQDSTMPDKPLQHKWENCMMIDMRSWGYRRNAQTIDIITIEELIGRLAITVSLGGNLLVNVGPTAHGTIAPIYEERLRQMGSWLRVNGEAIYESNMWTYHEDSITDGVRYTSQTNGATTTVYAILLQWPTGNTLTLGRPVATSTTTATLLGYPGDSFAVTSRPSVGIDITIPSIPAPQMPCHWAWVLKLTDLENARPKLMVDEFEDDK